MTTPDRSRPAPDKVGLAQQEEVHELLLARVIPAWTVDVDDDLLAEAGTRRLRLALDVTGRGLSLLELAALRAQRGISVRV
ncbi:hypothetical protein GCM10009616_11360 [Microlunatus lacustris]